MITTRPAKVIVQSTKMFPCEQPVLNRPTWPANAKKVPCEQPVLNRPMWPANVSPDIAISPARSGMS